MPDLPRHRGVIGAPHHPAGLVGVELDRVLTRLAGLGPARLSRPGPAGGPSAASLVRPVLQHLADAAADAGAGVGPRREVPVLADRAVPDQLAVLGADALAPGRHDHVVPAVHLPAPVLLDLADRLADLRRALP